ncbi:Neprilysin-1 [Schistosoma japonicum]|nr:Neprilysin-1 [Schistosoma japonicum]
MDSQVSVLDNVQDFCKNFLIITTICLVDANDLGGTHLGDINGSSSPNPCVDFYEFACEEWIKENPLLTESDSKTTFTQAQLNIDKFLWELVTNGLHHKDDSRLQEAKKFYKSCTNFRSPDTFISDLGDLISTYFSQWDLLPSTSHNDGAPNFENMVLTDFCLPAIIHSGSSPLFSLTMDPQTRSIKVDDPKSSQSGRSQRNIGLRKLSSICPQIRWGNLFEQIFDEADYKKWKGLPITIEGEEQLKQRCKQHALALQTDRKTFQTMMIINFLTIPLKYALLPTTDGTTDNFTSPFAYTFEKYYIPSHVNKTHKKEVTTIFKKVKRTVLKSIRKYNWLTEDQKIFLSNKIEKMEIHALYTSVRDSERKENISMIYRFSMRENDYYGNVFIIVKSKFLDVMRSILFDFDVSLSPPRAFMPKANNLRQENRIYVNPGLIQPPFYIDGGDTASKYGRIGFLIGHELFHAIDITGVWFYEKGDHPNFELFWALSNAIFDKTDCFQEQYGKNETIKHKVSTFYQDNCNFEYYTEAINSEFTYSYSLNTLLYKLFQTYKKLLEKLAGNVSQDPNTTSKHDQSFFRGFAQIFCGHHRGEALKVYKHLFPFPMERERLFNFHLQFKCDTLLINKCKFPISLNTFTFFYLRRVNVLLSNSKKFANAYDCPRGSPMNPSKKCRIY